MKEFIITNFGKEFIITVIGLILLIVVMAGLLLNNVDQDTFDNFFKKK